MGGKETSCFSPRFLIRRRRSSEGRKTFSSRMIWRSELSEGCLPLGASSSVERAFNRLLFVALGRGEGEASSPKHRYGEERKTLKIAALVPPSLVALRRENFSI